MDTDPLREARKQPDYATVTGFHTENPARTTADDEDDDPLPEAGIAGPTSGCSPSRGVVESPQVAAAADRVPP